MFPLRHPRYTTAGGCSPRALRYHAASVPLEQHGPLAQSVEHLTFNQVVAGSIPARPTTRIK